MPNPLIPQGTVNRLVSSLTWENFPELNVTPPYLSREMMRFARDGNAVTFIPTATGQATSPEPYLMVTITMVLLKTQGLAAAYEAQLQSNATLGECTIRPDVTEGIGAFDITNCAIETVGELTFDGSSAGYPITIRGSMPINNDLWP